MSEKKPVPIFSNPTPASCPVCGKPSYSWQGIHPQCAVKRADAVQRENLAARKLAESVEE